MCVVAADAFHSDVLQQFFLRLHYTEWVVIVVEFPLQLIYNVLKCVYFETHSSTLRVRNSLIIKL